MSQKPAYRTPDDGVPTHSSVEQERVENLLVRYMRAYKSGGVPYNVKLYRRQHVLYAARFFEEMPARMQTSEASRPWFFYWLLNALALLGEPVEKLALRMVLSLSHYQMPTGGFAGGPAPGFFAHLAPTYAAVCALLTLGTADAYRLINRATMYAFLLRMKRPHGAFAAHDDGEVDIRATYCAVSVAAMLNLLTPELTAGVADFIQSCQNWEGGISGNPGLEAHGGYAFCGLCAAILIGRPDVIDAHRLLARGSRFGGAVK